MGTPRTRSDASTEFSNNLLLENYLTGKPLGDTHVQSCISTVKANSSFKSRSVSRTMHDEVTPHFKRRIARGEIINSPMNSVVQIDNIEPAMVHVSNVKDVEFGRKSMNFPPYFIPGVILDHGYNWKGVYDSSMILGSTFTHLSPSSINVQNLKDLAVTQAHANVDMSEAQALMMMAEGEKTISSLKQIFKRAIRLYKIWNKIARMRYITGADKKFIKENLSPKEIANRYMEVRYSLRPLLYDAKAIVNALTPTRHFDRFTFRGYQKESTQIEAIGVKKDLITTRTRCYPKKRTVRTVEVRAGVLVAIDCDTVLNLWGFDQPIETLWETIPLSFVADWFFNIGQTIAAHTPEVGTRQLASWSVVKDTLSTECSVNSLTNLYTGDRVSVSNCSMSRNTVQVTRTVDPPLAFLPRFKVRLDFWKILDLGLILKNLSPKDGGLSKISRKMY